MRRYHPSLFPLTHPADARPHVEHPGARVARARRSNPLQAGGVEAVVAAVKFDVPLRRLKLGWCKFGSREGAEAIAQLLQFNESLQVWLACSDLATISSVPCVDATHMFATAFAA